MRSTLGVINFSLMRQGQLSESNNLQNIKFFVSLDLSHKSTEKKYSIFSDAEDCNGI